MLSIWWQAARPKTLPLSITPVILGICLSFNDLVGKINWLGAFATLLGAIFIQIGVNLHNDASDFLKGGDSKERIGPQRVTASGLIPPDIVKKGADICFLTAALLGIYLVNIAGMPILIVGVLSILCAFAYTAGPKPIAYTPLGELFVFIFFGLVAVCGSYYVQTLSMTPEVLVGGSTVGFFAAAVLAVNNYRDMEVDRKSGRRTLAIVLGKKLAKVEYTLLIFIPFAIPWDEYRYTWLCLPFAAYLHWQFWRLNPGPAFNWILARTAQLQIIYVLLLLWGVFYK